jgi:hypothetical protein
VRTSLPLIFCLHSDHNLKGGSDVQSRERTRRSRYLKSSIDKMISDAREVLGTVDKDDTNSVVSAFDDYLRRKTQEVDEATKVRNQSLMCNVPHN